MPALNKSLLDLEYARCLTGKNDELEKYFRNTIIPQLFVDDNLTLRKFTPPVMKQFNRSLDNRGSHSRTFTNHMNILFYIDYTTGNSNGVIITFVEISARITDLKEQENLIAEHEILLDTISHDAKNSLATVVLAVEHLKNIPPEEQDGFSHMLAMVDRSLLKMQAIINELFESRQKAHTYSAPGKD